MIVQQIGRTIREIKKRGFTVLLVEQNFRFAATVADRHYVMEHGQVIDMIPNHLLAEKWTSCTSIWAYDATLFRRSVMKTKTILTAAALLALIAGGGVAEAQQGPVKIGVLNDQSGLYADLSGKGSVEAAKMAAEDVGKVLGQPVEIVFADHQNKPDVGSAIAQKWYDAEGVDMIADVPTSSVALAVQQVSREKKKVVMFSGPAASEITGEKVRS